MAANYLTLSRQDLYDLVWSKPMVEVAKSVGISAVALGKRCRAVDIPVPPRGYWARVAAGQAPYQPKLPKVKRREPGQPEEEVRILKREPRPELRVPLVLAPLVTAPPIGLNDLLPAVKRAARVLRHPDRAQLTFARGTAHGPVPHVHVCAGLVDRAVRFADSFLRRCNNLGWAFESSPKQEVKRHHGNTPGPAKRRTPECGALRIGTVRIPFEICERVEVKTLPPTERELARKAKDHWYRPPARTEKIHTGVLRLESPSFAYPYRIPKKTWSDRRGRLIESKIPAILNDLAQTAAIIAAKNEELEKERIAEEEVARQRAAAKKRHEANAEMIEELERQAGAWHHARRLRQYVRAAKRALGEHNFCWKLQGTPVDFLEWASTYVDEIDPLSPTPRHPDRIPERSYVYSMSDRELAKLIGRWFNHDEYMPHKLLVPAKRNAND
jgi:hypothetical protein